MNKNLSIVVRLKDQITSPLQKIQKKAKELEKSVTKKKKVNVDTSQATNNLNKTSQAARKTKKEINSIKSKPVTVTAKDSATSVISKVKGRLKGIGKVPAIAINAKDKMSGILGGLKGKILSLKTLATGIVVTAVAKFALENAIKPGSELISQEVSMTHFLGGNKKSAQNYIKELRAEAKKTTFSSSEVISAGSRAIGITNGDTKQAMDLVRLSEDMSSLKPGKTISDAMEALADARMGEFERLKEFDFRGTKEEYDKSGGDLMKMKDPQTNKTLGDLFGGGAKKFEDTPAGKLAKIKGNISDGMADLGRSVLESLSPTLSKLIPISEKVGPAIAQFADKIIAVGGFLGTHLQPVAQAVGTALQEIWTASEPLRQVLSEVAEIVFPAVSSMLSEVLVPAISYLAQVVLPVLADFIRDEVVPVVKILAAWIRDELIPGIKQSAKWFNDHLVPAIKAVYKWFNDNLIPAIQTVYDWFQKLAGGLSSALEAVQNFGGSIRDAIGSVGSAIGGLFSAGDSGAGGSYRDGTISSHKTGLQRVPHDGFIAELHKNEAVVPAISNPYNRGNRLPAMGGMVKLAGVPAGGGTTNNNYNTFNITVTGNETDDQIDVMITKLKRKLANM